MGTPVIRCSAYARSSGQQCRQAVVPGRNVCHYHGGKTPRGIDAPNYRGRGYSKDIPTRLADRFKQALDDPQLLELSGEVALVDSRLGELLASLPDNPAATDRKVWGELRAMIEQRRRLVETERRREETLQANMTARQAMAFVAALQVAVAEVVTEPEQRRRLAERFRMLLTRELAVPAALTAGDNNGNA
jgi:hypothetical protein